MNRQLLCLVAALATLAAPAAAQIATPVHGHYPPGQTGLRGASAAAPGWSITDFNRLFSNLDVKDASGATVSHAGEARYANILMTGWTSETTILGMNYGALVGVPFATGNLNPEPGETGSAKIALGDIIVTPVSLYGIASDFDYQLQLSVWTPSGRFAPGSPTNRGSGFWSLIYSAGLIWYPGGDRQDWSISGVARLEQNFQQVGTGITPGNNLDLDWGIGKVLHLGPYRFDAGVSGFATWQVSTQTGGASTGRYHYYGAGPEISAVIAEGWALRLRTQWEFATHNAVQGNNIWLIVNTQL
ncbi:MAG TPA: transporter [Rhizomicrobium sp.]|nr:transporter [Rhizomicrobium sp.]